MALQRELFVFILLCCVLSKAMPQRAQVCGCNIAMCTQHCNTGDRLSTGCYKSVRNWKTRSCDNVYSCRVVDYYNPKYEVHVLSSYEARTDHRFNYHPVGKADVRIINSPTMSNSSRPIVLVLGSYEPITWNIEGLSSERIKQVILISYHSAKSQVTGVSNEKQEILQETSTLRVGYGANGFDTRKMLQYIVKRYGPITSFTGRYTANNWDLTVGVPINVTDALKSKRCSDAFSWTTGHGTHPIYNPTMWQRRTLWNFPTWVHPTWNSHHTVESSNQHENSYSVSIIVPFIIVAVVVAAIISIVLKCRNGSHVGSPRETGQIAQQRRELQNSTDAIIFVPPVRENDRPSPFHSSNTSEVNTAGETRPSNSGVAPPVQFTEGSNLFSCAPPSYEEAAAHVQLPSYQQAVGTAI